MDEGQREDLVGGGLVRTFKEKVLCHERILCRDEFVERILAEAQVKIAGQISVNERIVKASEAIMAACEREGVSVETLKGGVVRVCFPHRGHNWPKRCSIIMVLPWPKQPGN